MPEQADWPEPVEVLNEAGSSAIVLLCEHASNHIPPEYAGLGLPADELRRHIAWDIGAAAVTRRVSSLLDAAAFLGTYSRLLIDLNRPLDAPDSIPVRSEATDIPDNAQLTITEKSRRAELIFAPFHHRVARSLSDRQAARRPTSLVSIHSFTPTFFGVDRLWHAGVLFDRAAKFADAVLEQMRSPGLMIGINEPYKTDRLGDYAIPIHGDDRSIPAIMIEIRNDLIAEAVGVESWASRIAGAVSAVDDL
ncbi:MAG TPA: N-formylglutamate amidohydrolase [Acetobacteraceae bacterium]|nr:N-formylglutamate amidohydrolase [Acetobacteraceae bacterium]